MSGSLRCGSSLKLKVDLMKVQIPPPRWSFGRSRRQVAYPGIEMSWSVTFEDNQDSVITTISQLLFVIVHAMSSVLLTIDLALDKNNLGNDVVPGLWVALLTLIKL